MKIYFLDDDRTIARVIRRRWFRRVTAILYRDDRCSGGLTATSARVGWVFEPRRPGQGEDLRRDDWEDGFRIEQLRTEEIEAENDPWHPVPAGLDPETERRRGAPTARVLEERTHDDPSDTVSRLGIGQNLSPKKSV